MKFSKFNKLTPIESKAASSVLYEDMPRVQFAYSNYNTDPRPNVLVLSRQIHPNTNNELIYGINLNYLSKQQLVKLLKASGQVYSVPEAKRYDRLESLIPDVAQYYRSYDEDFMHKIEKGDLKDFISKVHDGGSDVDTRSKEKADRVDATRDFEQDVRDHTKDTEEQDDDVDAGREAWELERQLYDPETGEENDPEDDKDSETSLEKRRRYRMQQRKLNDIKRRSELERMAKQLRQDTQEPEEFDFGDDNLEVRDPEQDDVLESYYYSPEIGFVWDSQDDYIRSHDVDRFIIERKDIGSILEASVGEKFLSVYDTITGKLIVDLGSDHNVMLHEAGWYSSRCILFETDGRDLLIKHDYCSEDDIDKAINAFKNSTAALLMTESI